MSYPIFPKKIIFQTQSRCIGRCKFCPSFSLREINSQGEMQEQLFKKIISECKSYKENIDLIIPYLMNEPLMDKNLETKIDFIKKNLPNVSIHILSNGFLLDQKRQDSILKSKLDWVGISFFGINKKYYEEAMGIPFDITKQRVESFIKKSLKIKGSDYVMITFFNWKGIDNREAELAIDYFRGLGVKRISHFQKGISRAGNIKHYDYPDHKIIKGCNSIWTNEMIHILFNGDVILCCMDWKRKHVIGNLYEQSIREIWNGEKYNSIRKQINGEKKLDLICRNCEMAITE